MAVRLPLGNRLKRMESRDGLLLLPLLVSLSSLLLINLQILSSSIFFPSHLRHPFILPPLSKCLSSVWPDQLLSIHLAVPVLSQEYYDWDLKVHGQKIRLCANKFLLEEQGPLSGPEGISPAWTLILFSCQQHLGDEIFWHRSGVYKKNPTILALCLGKLSHGKVSLSSSSPASSWCRKPFLGIG